MKRFINLVAIFIAVVLSGCALRQSQAQENDRATAQVGIVNNTGNFIYSASVDGAGGGDMSS